MNEKLLVVDDDAAIVTTLHRYLRKHFEIETALSGPEALKAIETSGPYAVVMSDLTMPGMSGIELLARVKALWPDTIRVLLTGQVDIDSALTAVNEGYIYRFLTKPCPPELILRTLTDALVQYRLGIAEREVLEETLLGALGILAEILSLVHPMAFSRAGILRCYVRQMATGVKLSDRWQLEAAALLSQIGLISVPAEAIEKLYLGEPLSESERIAFEAHPVVGQQLLARIPRLRSIAEMVRCQQPGYAPSVSEESPDAALITLGGQMLRLALDLDRLITEGCSIGSATEKLRSRDNGYRADLLETIETIKVAGLSPDALELEMFAGRTNLQLESMCRPTPIAAQVWEALNGSDSSALGARPLEQPSVPEQQSLAPTAQHQALEALVNFVEHHFDEAYLSFPGADSRLMLRQLFMLARDACCDTAGNEFNEHRVAAEKMAAELQLHLARIAKGCGHNTLTLDLLLPAVNLATRLASLADRPTPGWFDKWDSASGQS